MKRTTGWGIGSVLGTAAAILLAGSSTSVRAAEPASKGKPAAPATVKAAVNVVQGSYLEARSASVYAGACHYNGELTTAGREAVLAWRITAGQANGVKLAGVRMLAVVAGNDNLGFPQNSRRSVVYIDSTATPAQRDAAVGLLKARVGAALGEVIAVKRAPLTFTEDGTTVRVVAQGVADVNASRYPCAHCRMPAETWYGPLTDSKSEVAEGVSTGFSDKTLGVSWSQTASDNVYVGTFQMKG